MRAIATILILAIFGIASMAYGWQITPQSILTDLSEMIGSNELIEHVWSSLKRVMVGLTLGVCIALFLGCLAATGGVFGGLLHAWGEFLRPIPPIAWIPVAILWQGLGDPSAILVVTIGAFFPTFIATYEGLKSCPRDLVTVSESLGARGWKLFLFVKFPNALPQIFIGLKISIGLAWMTVIAAELIGSQSGLGYLIQSSRLVQDFDGIFIGMFFIGLIGLLMTLSVNFLGLRLFPFLRGRA